MITDFPFLLHAVRWSRRRKPPTPRAMIFLRGEASFFYFTRLGTAVTLSIVADIVAKEL